MEKILLEILDNTKSFDEVVDLFMEFQDEFGGYEARNIIYRYMEKNYPEKLNGGEKI